MLFNDMTHVIVHLDEALTAMSALVLGFVLCHFPDVVVAIRRTVRDRGLDHR